MTSGIVKCCFAFAAAPWLLSTIGCGSASKEKSGGGENAKTGFTNIVVSDDKSSSASKASFSKDTPELFVTFGLNGLKPGDKIKGSWICVESKAAPPNYEIKSATLDIGPGVNSGNFSLTKPTKGWPEGSYRVDLFINDKVSDSVTFTIAP